MTIFNLVIAGFECDASKSGPVLFCVADAEIESTPFKREGRAIVTREAGVGAVMAVKVVSVAARSIVLHQLLCHRSDDVSQVDRRNMYLGRIIGKTLGFTNFTLIVAFHIQTRSGKMI